jgi:hypothetical protein
VTLRPPLWLDASAPAYKDWLHLNVFDHDSGSVGLVNVSLHGPPGDRRAQAVGTALMHVPGAGWAGNVEVLPQRDARTGTASVALEQVALALDHRAGTAEASVRFPQFAFGLRLTARAQVPAILREQRLPLGPGWISWYVVPRLAVEGEATVGSRRLDLRNASAYHDHNWGRWHWGEDLGWEWGTFLAPGTGPAFVFSRTADRSHRHLGRPSLIVEGLERRRIFSGPGVTVSFSGYLAGRPRRLPGAMAVLHEDRVAPRLPQAVSITADDGIDRVRIDFTGEAAAQIIAADPMRPGFTFIHETAGSFTYDAEVGRLRRAGGGLGVFEYVD